MTEKLKKLTTSQGDNLLLLLILAIAVTLVSMKQANFFSLGTLESICYQLPEMGLLTMAMMVPMLSGGINLSMIASANLSGIVMALIMTENISKGEDNVGIVIGAVAVGILISTLVGLINGVIIAYFKIPAMLVTLGMQMLLNGACLVITKGATISGYPASFKFLGNGKLGFIPMPFVLFAAALILLVVFLKNTPFGPKIYLYGSNNVATGFSGVDDKVLLMKTYTISGLLVGLAAVILTSRFNSAAAGYAESFLMQSILIAVLGGISPDGGKGKASGMVLSVIIIQVVASGLNILRISSYLTTAVYGLILLAAVAFRSKKSGN